MLTMIGLALLTSAFMVQNYHDAKWDDPFQGPHFRSLPGGTEPLKRSDCDGAEFNKCTFNTVVDFDGDGKRDRAYMANAGSHGIIVVRFSDRRRKPMVVASFRDRLGGDSYLFRDPDDPKIIVFVQPEASMAEIRMIAGKPRMRWIGD